MALTNAERQARHRTTQQARLTYAAAIDWLCYNDCRGWWMHDGPVSVTAGFVADCYGRTTEQVRNDLRAFAKMDRAEAWESSPGVPRQSTDD